MENNYEKIKKDIEIEQQRRKEEDRKNQKLINQIKVIQKLKNKLEKEERKLDSLVNSENKETQE
ncbi:hypothetical protein HL736_001205 [Campylobacter lari]|uniref:hypothetical protein n=1 Tax=Campylobacter volucris TaxID=1031542 RepID=UPI00189D0BD1|nr:hypothetical protein [Campylobacter volucris]EFO9318197.1 hypothetical protein [Campylobacter lari]MBF7049639.1 hypothetical protein [Campylobacter volucris]HED1004885.1 hypothetical protein [Campylobacter jejuni]